MCLIAAWWSFNMGLFRYACTLHTFHVVFSQMRVWSQFVQLTYKNSNLTVGTCCTMYVSSSDLLKQTAASGLLLPACRQCQVSGWWCFAIIKGMVSVSNSLWCPRLAPSRYSSRHLCTEFKLTHNFMGMLAGNLAKQHVMRHLCSRYLPLWDTCSNLVNSPDNVCWWGMAIC